MVRMIILLWLMIISCTRATNITTPRTALVVKEIHTYDGSKTVSRQGSYMALLEYNKAFIDKSLLIKEVLEQEEKVVLITRPRRWGKTANLGMIGTFLEIQMTEHHHKIEPREQASNYRLFKNGDLIFRKGKVDKLGATLLISKYPEIMDQHQGQYPVIEVNFEAWLSSSYEGMEKTLRHRMSDIFFEFKFMKDIFCHVIASDSLSNKEKIHAKKSLDHFKLIQKSRGDAEQTKTALVFLSEILNWHFKKPAIILVNEYDTPLINMINDRGVSTDDKLKFITFYEDFVRKTFKENGFLKKAVLTGILRIFKASTFYSPLYRHKYAYVDDPFFEFYGFTDTEADWLFDYYNISQTDRVKARDWCCGYHAYGKPTPSVCLPLSFVRFLFDRQLANYWVETGNEIIVIKGFMNISSFRETLLSLVCGNDLIMNLEDLHFNVVDYMEFQQYVNATDIPETKSDHFISLVFRYFWGHGYLTYSHNAGPKLQDIFNLTHTASNQTRVRLKYPNREISKYMENFLINYYEEKLGILFIASFNMKNLKDKFKEFVINDEHRSDKLEEFFEDYFVLLGSALEEVIFVEKYTPGLLNYLILLVEGAEKLWFAERPLIARPDVVLRVADRVVIIEYTLEGKSGQGALKRALKYEDLVKKSGITKKIKFIGINISYTKKVSIYAQVKKV